MNIAFFLCGDSTASGNHPNERYKSYLVNKGNLVHNISYYVYISFLYMFRATMCPSSGETTVSMRHLVLVTLCRWLSGMHRAWQTVIHTEWQIPNVA